MCSWFGGPWFGGGIFMMIIFWALVIAGGVALFRVLVRGNRNGGTLPTNSALEILKQRYAKGEISREEFERMKQDLL
jgi:putative membrane protein